MNLSEETIYQLHQKYAHGKYKDKMLEIGWTHSLIVKSISLQIADKLEKVYGIKTDKKLITIGALLHDIGFYNYFDDDYKKIGDYVLHGRIGYEILIKEEVLKKIARFALTHVGVGYKNDIPISLEEEIVCYADSFHSKGHPHFGNFEDEKNKIMKFNKDSGVIMDRFRKKFGEPDLKQLEEKYHDWHKNIKHWIDEIR